MAASVVHCWPWGPMYCRSSSQMGQAAGGWALAGYCVPQVTQMYSWEPGASVVVMVVPPRCVACYVLRIAWATPHPRPLSHNGRGETDGVRNTLRVRLVERVDHLAGHGGGDDGAFAAVLDHSDGGQPGAVDRAEGCEPGVRGTPL